MTPEWSKALPWDVIRNHAGLNGLDPYLVAAIIEHESHGESFKPHLDPGWRYFWYPKDFAEKLLISTETESALQSMSWGCMQVEGAVARQHGFKDDIPKLCQAELSIQYGCVHLKWLRTYKNCETESDLIASYNEGHPGKTSGGLYLNQPYVDGVDRYLRELRALS